MQNSKRNTLILNIVLIVFGLIFYLLAGQIVVTKEPGRLGPDFWPKTFSLIIVVVSAIDIVMSFIKKKKDYCELKEEETFIQDEECEPELPKYPILLIAGIVSSFLYVFLLNILGFLISTALYLAAIMIIGRYRKPIVIISSSLIGSFLILVIFAKIVYISLPTGIGVFGNFTFFLYRILGVK